MTWTIEVALEAQHLTNCWFFYLCIVVPTGALYVLSASYFIL